MATTDAGFPAGYPAHRAVHVALRDGSTIGIRPVLPGDLEGIALLLDRLSPDSLRMRFHGASTPSEKLLRSFVEVDYRDRFALIAERGRPGSVSIMALATFVRTAPTAAEMAIVVDDELQGLGLGSVLIEHLGEAAGDSGIALFEADVLATNSGMLDVLRNLKVPLSTSLDAGVVRAEFPTAPEEAAIAAFEEREAISSAGGVARVLAPRSVAVIGASRRRGTIAGETFRNLLEGGFEGPVYPVNPKADVVQSVPAYASVLDVPGEVDLAVIVVPSQVVLQAAAECGEKGVKALVVISAGFAETGPDGRALQRELLGIARSFGMRIVGPNCMGVMNTAAGISLNASFAPTAPLKGRLGFSSQSGALGIAVIDLTRELGLGLSSFVSVGNKADISGNDLLQFWERDPETDVILLYLESFGNPRKFARLARRIGRTKPIVAVKSGRSTAGARAAASHTGSIAAGDVAVDALFEQAGVIRTDTLEQLFDVASLLANQPIPAGNRVGILTNAGGLGILCADACEAAGLEVPEISDRTREGLKAILPAEAGISNPVDMIASASAEQYAASLRLLASDPGIDSVIVIFIPPLVTRAEDVAAALSTAARDVHDKTVLTCFLGVHGIHEHLRSDAGSVPSFTFPEAAAAALGKVAGYGRWRARPPGRVPTLDGVDRLAARRLVADMAVDGGAWLDQTAVADLLGSYGIRTPRSIRVASPSEVGSAAKEIGGRVVVKLDSQTLQHKTEVGGVRLGLTSPAEAGEAAEDMARALAARDLLSEGDGFLVQEMVTGEGHEFFAGVDHDPLFGPLLAIGAGGTLVELMRDVSVRIAPVTEDDLDEMLRGLKLWPLFGGYRSQPPLDLESFRSLIFRVSAMVSDLPHIRELDLNPIRVGSSPDGCVVLDARVRVEPPSPVPSMGARLTG